MYADNLKALPVKKYDKYLGRLQTRLFNEDDLQSKKILEKRINSVNKIKVEKKQIQIQEMDELSNFVQYIHK